MPVVAPQLSLTPIVDLHQDYQCRCGCDSGFRVHRVQVFMTKKREEPVDGTEAPLSERHGRFISRFGIGDERGRGSSVWRVWTARKQPDLYLAVAAIGGTVKSTVHLPRDGKPTERRHSGFTAQGFEKLPDAVRTALGTRHRATWMGEQFAPGCSLEWRILIPHSGLDELPPYRKVSGVVWLPRPAVGKMIEVAVVLGPDVATKEWPGKNMLGTRLLAEGRLYGGRRVWVVWHEVSEADLAAKTQAVAARVRPFLESAIEPSLRGVAVGNEPAGSLCLIEMSPSLLRSIARGADVQAG